jgi:hypothetical protein
VARRKLAWLQELDVNSGELIRPLFDGPIDVIGDVHGEIDALQALLAALGYNPEGSHPQGRRLVFVGDLGDRGPDSPAVIAWVRYLVECGRAQCVLGNHELNLLRNESKQGNRWFIDPAHPEQAAGGDFAHCRVAPEALKAEWLEFIAGLPLALERNDLRVVHAAWIPGEIEALRHRSGSIVDVYRHFEACTQSELVMEGLLEAAHRDEQKWGAELENRAAQVPLLARLGLLDERYQMGNPVRVVTSGVEQLAPAPFWSSGKWRMCARVRWWDEYRESVPVIVGHYWRRASPMSTSDHVMTKPEMFDDVPATQWVGPEQNVFCVDFSVGGRYQERKARVTHFQTRLGAVRWPERELWFETGRVAPAASALR